MNDNKKWGRKKFYSSDEMWEMYRVMDTDPQAALVLKEQVERIVTPIVAAAMKRSYGHSIVLQSGMRDIEDSEEWTTLESVRDSIVDKFLYGPKAAAKTAHTSFEALLKTVARNAINDLGTFHPIRISFVGDMPVAESEEGEEVEADLLPGKEHSHLLYEYSPERLFTNKRIREEIYAGMTDREREVVTRLQRGATFKEVREELGLSEAALKNIVYRLRKENQQ